MITSSSSSSSLLPPPPLPPPPSLPPPRPPPRRRLCYLHHVDLLRRFRQAFMANDIRQIAISVQIKRGYPQFLSQLVDSVSRASVDSVSVEDFFRRRVVNAPSSLHPLTRLPTAAGHDDDDDNDVLMFYSPCLMDDARLDLILRRSTIPFLVE